MRASVTLRDGGAAAGGQRTSVAEIAVLFLKLGVTSFGGPAVHIAMMEDEVVTRRRWLSRDQFLDLVGATNLIPGPNSTEMAIHIGHVRAGWPGLLVAGICFVLPASLIVSALAWAYVRLGSLPQTSGVLYGVKPVVIAIVLQALWRLGRTAVKTWMLAVLALAAAAAAFQGVDEIAILAAGGALVAVTRHARTEAAGAALLVPLAQGGLIPGAAGSVALAPLCLFFLKVGAVLFGSGYVLIAFLHTGLVLERGWLTESQLLDAIAIGQVTPGPLSTTATFIGYVLAGAPGAIVATLGIFLPAFVLVALSAPLVPRIRRSAAAGSVLDGVNVASLALMAVAALRLATTAIVDAPTAVLAIGSALSIMVLRVHSGWVVLGAAIVGVLIGTRS
jgi:chromate transporter